MQTTIAFLGTGLMGYPMALRLISAGHQVHAWNRIVAKAMPLKSAGACIANSVNEAVNQASVIITMLEAGPIVRDVIEQAMRDIRPSSIVIDMSSTKQSEAIELSQRLREKSVQFLDAPVSGGVIGAEQGTLAIMVGGEKASYCCVESILKVFSRPHYVGPSGCGQLAKLCNQLIVGGTLAIVAEALLLAQAGGADAAAVRQALRGGFAESRILEVHGQRMLERNFIPGGQIKSQDKDMFNVLAAADDAGLTLPLAEMIRDLFHSQLAETPNADQSAALLALEKRNPGKRLGKADDQLPSSTI